MSVRCGGFCCWFIYEMSSGKSFDSIVNFLYSIENDDEFIREFMKRKFDYEII